MTEGRGASPVIVCLGELLVDFVAQETGVEVGAATTFVKSPGGAIANVAVGLARLGARSRFVGKVGQDPFGRFLHRTMTKEGVDTSSLIFSDQYQTALVFVALDEQRTPSFSFFGDPSADMMLRAEEVGPETLQAAGFLHVGTVSLVREEGRAATMKLIRLARELKVKLSFDPNFRLHLWKDHALVKKLAREIAGSAALLKLNHDELIFLTGEQELRRGAEMIMEWGAEEVVVTLGPEGAYFLGREGEGQAPGFPVEVVDTTGAGDGFIAGLLAFLGEESWPPALDRLAAAVRFANAVAALVTTKVGAVAGLPRRAEVAKFIAVAKISEGKPKWKN